MISELAAAGASAFRLNASHMSVPDVAAMLGSIRGACPAVPVVVDLQGAKMRLGAIPDRRVRKGEQVVFSIDPSGASGLPVPHPELYAQVTTGQTLRIDDDRLRFEVTEVTPGSVVAIALDEGIVRARKGINLVEHPLDLDALSEVDRALCRLTASFAPAALAFSFMKDGREAAWVRAQAPGCQVIGKIERQDAMDNLPRIDAAVDAVWVCRGDLGAQLGPAGLARWVATFDPRALRCPVLMAGQVLEHLTTHAAPTRSEVCHLYDLLSRGYGGIVLSDETAIGVDPVQAVRTATSLLRAFRGL
ncbi:MAG: hypothetical protein IMZ44_18330 [Planctomycetes bacterium]|nr:hypothetical protein [Planctomycetota bacterium]